MDEFVFRWVHLTVEVCDAAGKKMGEIITPLSKCLKDPVEEAALEMEGKAIAFLKRHPWLDHCLSYWPAVYFRVAVEGNVCWLDYYGTGEEDVPVELRPHEVASFDREIREIWGVLGVKMEMKHRGAA